MEAAMSAACALEMVHTYSLIHDDLPRWMTTTSAAGCRPATRSSGTRWPSWAGDALARLSAPARHGLPQLPASPCEKATGSRGRPMVATVLDARESARRRRPGWPSRPRTSCGRSAARAEVVVIHRGQIVVNQRVGVHHFEGTLRPT